MSTEEKKENNKSDERKAQLEEIKEMGSVAAFDGKHKIYCCLLYTSQVCIIIIALQSKDSR